jgi:transposase
MLLLSSASNYFIYTAFTDMRKGFDSLSGIVLSQMQFNPLSGGIFIFINRRRTQLKLLQWEGDGFAIYYKRLEQGTYEMPEFQADQCSISISSKQLQNIFQGITMRRNYQRKRYQHVV